MCVPYVSALEINVSPMIICHVHISCLGAICMRIRLRIVILVGVLFIVRCVLMV